MAWRRLGLLRPKGTIQRDHTMSTLFQKGIKSMLRMCLFGKNISSALFLTTTNTKNL